MSGHQDKPRRIAMGVRLAMLRKAREMSHPVTAKIPMAAKTDDETWIRTNLDTDEERVLFDRYEVLKAMHAVRQHILERAYAITRMGSSLHNPGDQLDHLIKELEAGRTLEP